ncbi:NADH-quinone oxidoreductase subunit C [Fulvivirga sediminis]|uniref:NADH-quinone oxidoreductase subunit C n=1 Tax=Fulvivirga sediminis TaxID=2803949 RepID=A0A937FDS7_9BACT|nr:NADH-quinone oxidoreductase subunit C [Fulvivirga sediminis]MBL3658909.1 NADH-quinone oxidoreductase subunit C [Fulvivirga sediminis]
MQFEDIIAKLREEHGEEIIVEVNEEASPKMITVKSEDLLQVSEVLYKNESLFFDMLSCITGVDNGPEMNTMEVIYNFYSIPFEHSLMLKIILPRENPAAPSLVNIWKTADWHERETYDLLGIHFDGHPDLRRLLMPADWEGHPLRKDYKNLEYYRGIKVEY